MTECIDLQARFGQRYQIGCDPAYSPQGRAWAKLDPWFLTIPCLHGHICPCGGTLLAAYTMHHGPVARQLARLPFARVVQHGDDGANVLFDVAHFAAVARIMKPRRKRQVSEAERQRLAAIGTRTRRNSRHSARSQGPDLRAYVPA